MNKQLIHVLSGNTQLLRDPRRMSREVDPACDAVWSLEDFDTLLRRYLFEEYPSIPHAGLGGMTPAERFKQGAETLAVGHPLPDSPDLRFLLWPYAKRRTAMVHRQRGMVVDRRALLERGDERAAVAPAQVSRCGWTLATRATSSRIPPRRVATLHGVELLRCVPRPFAP